MTEESSPQPSRGKAICALAALIKLAAESPLADHDKVLDSGLYALLTIGVRPAEIEAAVLYLESRIHE